MAVLGFVILSHSETPQLARLISSLNKNYFFPPIVIHHDFSQSRLSLSSEEMGDNVSVVKPHYPTRWSHISIVDSFLTALEMLFDQQAPDWFTLLSAACYPVAKGTHVLRELENSAYDAYVEHHNISAGILSTRSESTPRTPKEIWFDECRTRYISTVRSPNLPFTNDFNCYVGEHWFTGNSKAAKALVASRRERNELFYHYSAVFCPEESYYQTVLANRQDLKLCGDNKRYADWSLGGSHPKELTENDLQDVLKSNCHFARKFAAYRSENIIKDLDRLHAEAS